MRFSLALIIAISAACGSPPPETPDATVIDAGTDSGAPDTGPEPTRRPVECVDTYDVFSSQSLFLREGRRGPLLFSEVLSRGAGTWHGLFVDGSQVSEGDRLDLSAASTDPTTCAVCYFLGTECSDPADWRTCETMRIATSGRVWIGRFPSAPGDDVVVELSDVFLEPRTLDRATLRTASAEGGCVYQRHVSYTTGAVGDGELPCVGELHCPFAER